MGILPYRVKVFEERVPVANYVLIAFTCAAFLFFEFLAPGARETFVLRGWRPAGLAGHVFLHGDWAHLIGNMLFLFVFGNAACAKLGTGKYVGVYFLSGLGAATAHLLIDGDPAVGASGAISGVMAAYVVLYPRNPVQCLWVQRYYNRWHVERMEIRGLWLVAMWIFLDAFWALLNEGVVAHWAHLGGYGAGFALIALLIAMEMIEFRPEDRPLLGGGQVPREVETIVTERAKRRPSPPQGAEVRRWRRRSRTPRPDRPPGERRKG